MLARIDNGTHTIDILCFALVGDGEKQGFFIQEALFSLLLLGESKNRSLIVDSADRPVENNGVRC